MSPVKLFAAITETLELPAETAVEDIIKAAQAAFDEAKSAADSVVDAAANELANGKKIKNAEGADVDNPVYLYAIGQLKGLRGKQLNEKIEKLKADPVMVSLRSKQADTRVNAESGEAEKKSPIRKV